MAVQAMMKAKYRTFINMYSFCFIHVVFLDFSGFICWNYDVFCLRQAHVETRLD